MNRILEALRSHATSTPRRVAIEDGDGVLTYADLLLAVTRAGKKMRSAGIRTVALLADNGRRWVVADLAAQWADIRLVPVPPYMSSTQIDHVLTSAGIDYVLTDQPERMAAAGVEMTRDTDAVVDGLAGFQLSIACDGIVRIPADTRKITFTSGTTGNPKGVCLGVEALQTTATALCESSSASPSDRHLCLLPLATLLENVGGVYAAILVGATLCALPLADVGMAGSSGLDVVRMLSAMKACKATSVIAVPQMVIAMVAAIGAGAPAPKTLRHLAVGGAPIARHVIRNALGLGLPVREGYGLTECGSVVALNRDGATRVGSVGKPLPHVVVELADDGEILVGGSGWLGYLGEQTRLSGTIATGDIGFVDEDGYLHVTGRKKNIFITSFGRNVAPEWVESELVSRTPILQAAIFGDARPFNTVVVVVRPEVCDAAIQQAIDEANATLPDYAQARAWVRTSEPFSFRNGMTTPNGRLLRAAILSAHAPAIDAIHEHHTTAEGA